MSARVAHSAYAAVFALAGLLSVLLGSLVQMTMDNYGCKTGYADDRDGQDRFLAYCASQRYADYEHGALYYGTERAAEDGIRNAEVLFLGNSRMQVAFSTKAVRSYFAARNVRHFVLGWGYGEWSGFSLATLKRRQAAPALVVINADPFFSDELSVPAQEALKGEPAYLWRLMVKMLFQCVHPALCWVPGLCPETRGSIFRSARDGQWEWVGPYVRDRSVPMDNSERKQFTPEAVAEAAAIGEAFLAEIGIDRRCVLLTGVPTSTRYVDAPGLARAIADRLGTRSIFPPEDGLSTVDKGHLNLVSAERYSGQFVEEMTPILDECLALRGH